MGVFDFITQAQTEATEKAEALQKKTEEKMEDLAAKLSGVKTATTNNRPIRKKRKRKTTAHKPDLSIEGISKQIMKQRDSIMRNGFKHYEFIANKNCCDVCSALNGRHFPVSKLVIGVNAPPMHDACRCSIAAWENDEEYEAWLDFIDKGGTTKQWKRRNNK